MAHKHVMSDNDLVYVFLFAVVVYTLALPRSKLLYMLILSTSITFICYLYVKEESVDKQHSKDYRRDSMKHILELTKNELVNNYEISNLDKCIDILLLDKDLTDCIIYLFRKVRYIDKQAFSLFILNLSEFYTIYSKLLLIRFDPQMYEMMVEKKLNALNHLHTYFMNPHEIIIKRRFQNVVDVVLVRLDTCITVLQNKYGDLLVRIEPRPFSHSFDIHI